MESKIKVLYKEPGKAAVKIEIENTLEELQRLVGGYIEAFPFASNATVICNEEGKLRGMQPNCYFLGELFVGPILFCGVKGENLCNLSEASFEMLMKLFERINWRNNNG